MRHENITLCLTIGRRPELLRQTLTSLLKYGDFFQIIAVNDFRDEATNQVFRELCPRGDLIVMPDQLGHHKAVDLMYSKVKTPYIFHCEDDWFFDEKPDIDAAIKLLGLGHVSQVCFRKLSDFRLGELSEGGIHYREFDGLSYATLEREHPQWHGFSFNPSLIKVDLIGRLGKFSSFKKERHVSRWMRSNGYLTTYLQPGACHHIGWDDSVVHPDGLPKSSAKKFFASIKNLLTF
jgi:glycosyltransferase involved in cell wall biosynthesis